jgi:pyruvate/2-oxoglutarate dehydrogenase complex dihydrolipoamide dehydrogenase (E3) component
MTQAQAAEAGLDVLVGKADMAATARGWIHGPGNDGFIRIIADAGRRVVVGATVIGPCGGEVMSALAVAIHAEVPVDRLLHMIYAYPTFHRGIQDALRDLRQPS